MNKTPLISIITPVYNGLPFLKECVESVLAQNIENWELLISDDGSGDGSKEYLLSLTDVRIKIFIQKKNLGIFDNLNFLFQQSTANIAQILCQDDYFIKPTSLSNILKYWSATSEEVGFVRFNHELVKPSQLTGYQKKVLPKIVTPETSSLWFYLFGNIPGNLSNVSLRTSIVKECGWFNQEFPYAGDFEFWSRANKRVSMGIEGENVVVVRRHSNVASNYLNKNGELIDQRFKIVNNLYFQLVNSFPKLKFLFKLHAGLNYEVCEREYGIKLYLKGNKKYLIHLKQASATNSDFLLPLYARWYLLLFSIGGRLGRVYCSKSILKRIINHDPKSL